MNLEDEIDKILKESMEIVQAERAKAAEYDKLSYREKCARKRGFANYAEYSNWWAQQKGFINFSEYYTYRNHIRGRCQSMSKNKNCAQYLGIYIAERLIPDIFQDPIMMPHNNRGYDTICKNNYKVDIKSSVYRTSWTFRINHNNIANAFLLIAFDNREDLNVKYIWLIPGAELIHGKKLNEFQVLTISNYTINQFKKYKLTDKIDKANNICIMFKNGVLK